MSTLKAQSTLEFTFAMIVIMFLIYGMVMVFRWAGMDLANRRVTADMALTNISVNPNDQLNPYLGTVQPMATVYHGAVTNGNTAQ